MKLGGKARDVDSFVDQLKEEGETVSMNNSSTAGKKVVNLPQQIVNTEPYVFFDSHFLFFIFFLNMALN